MKHSEEAYMGDVPRRLALPTAVLAATSSEGHTARTWPGEEFAEGFFIARFELAAEPAS